MKALKKLTSLFRRICRGERKLPTGRVDEVIDLRDMHILGSSGKVKSKWIDALMAQDPQAGANLRALEAMGDIADSSFKELRLVRPHEIVIVIRKKYPCDECSNTFRSCVCTRRIHRGNGPQDKVQEPLNEAQEKLKKCCNIINHLQSSTSVRLQ